MINAFFNHKKILWQEADFYGAANLIFDIRNKPIVYRASWMHGMGYSFSGINHPDNFIHPDEISLPNHYVNNKESVLFLKNNNINSKAIGMPFVYTFDSFPSFSERYIDNLFIPEHDISSPQEYKFKNFLSLCKKYKCDGLLLSKNDFIRAKKIKFNFEDIKIFCGADITNPSALQDLSELLQSTKSVYSDVFGSHIYYALSSGCNLYLVDEIMKNYTSDKRKIRKKSIQKSISKSFKQKVNSNYFPLEELLGGIWGSSSMTEKKEYSDYMIGLDMKLPREDLISGFTPRSFKEKYNIIKKLTYKKISRKLSI